MATFSVIAQSPFQSFAARSGITYTADKSGVVSSVPFPDVSDLISAGCNIAGVLDQVNNLSATTDPTVNSDNTLDYSVGSHWVNTTNGRVWICQSAATGAAAWALAVVPGTGIEPASNLEQFGSGTGTVLAEGNLGRQVSAAGVNPGATAADNVLAVLSIPSNSLDGTGNRGLTITAAGSFAATGNNKRVKIIFNPSTAVVGSTVGSGGTTICDTGTVATNNAGWQLQGSVFKYGAANSNTQIGIHNQAQIGAAVASMLAPSLITATENAAILLAITGNATTATTDIVFNWLEVNAMN
jgi:hypothetical protein